MLLSWRWFGPVGPISPGAVRQTGARGVVTALHHVPIGQAWPEEEIARRKAEVEAAGLEWAVVESIPVSEAIKTRTSPWREHVAAWALTLRRLAAAGVRTICYNFMPVADWTRTELAWPVPSGALALRFDMTDYAAYDLFLLERPGAGSDYPPDMIASAEARFRAMSRERREALERTIVAGLPGTDAHYHRAGFRRALAAYDGLSAETLREHLHGFLREVAPIAAEGGQRLCIHPDDPPFPLFGLPRIVSTEHDIADLLSAVDDHASDLTFCTGSLGARGDNDVAGMAQRFSPRIAFAHLRNVRREADGSFFESDHLDGDVDMVGVIAALLDEEARREREGRADATIPMRPDHGHMIGPDIGSRVNPGYSYVGRLRGLAELRGVITALGRQSRGCGGSEDG